MTLARRSIVTAIYKALLDDNENAALNSWLGATRSVRGPLERKRAADRVKLAKFLEVAPDSVDVERFLFATEAYLTVRAELLVEVALQCIRGTSLGRPSGASFKSLVENAAKHDDNDLLGSSWLTDVISSLPSDVVEAEYQSATDMVNRLIGGSLFDAMQADHQELIPKELRHMTGVYYTPQNLAQYVLRRAGYDSCRDDLASLTVIDPACGSGVFLVAAAEELRLAVQRGKLDHEKARDALSSNVMGCDVDRLAIIQATANLRLAAILLGDTNDDVRTMRPAHLVCRDSLTYDGSIPPADVVVGNPPWVNWEYLPRDYRNKHEGLWPELGLFELKGRERAFSKEDISALFMAVAVDQYARDGANISLIVPQSLIKSALNHRAFRKFSLRGGDLGLFGSPVQYRVREVEDMVAVRPFEGVANRTIVIHAKRGEPTTYPVPYKKWLRVKNNSFDPRSAEIAEEFGEPSNSADLTSHWTTGPASTLKALRTIEGSSFYRARTGLFTGGANAVFHIQVLDYDDQTARVRNITERAKRAVPEVEAELELDYIYPFLRGRDVGQWNYQSDVFTLLPHTAATRMDPVDESTLSRGAPRTFEYFQQFKDILAERGGFVGWERKALEVGFYACQRVGEYTFSPWKVVWRYIAPKFTCAVVGPCENPGPFYGKPVIPNEKLMTIACNSKEEAYYLCGLLSTSCAISFIHSRMISTQIAPHLIQGLEISEFEPDNAAHIKIADICMKGHELSMQGASLPSTLIQELDDVGSDILGVPSEAAEQLRQKLTEDGYVYDN